MSYCTSNTLRLQSCTITNCNLHQHGTVFLLFKVFSLYEFPQFILLFFINFLYMVLFFKLFFGFYHLLLINVVAIHLIKYFELRYESFGTTGVSILVRFYLRITPVCFLGTRMLTQKNINISIIQNSFEYMI
jgi:hypothetical protein